MSNEVDGLGGSQLLQANLSIRLHNEALKYSADLVIELRRLIEAVDRLTEATKPGPLPP